MGVDQVVVAGGERRLSPQHVAGERAQLPRQLGFGEALERAGDDMPHQDTGLHLDDRVEVTGRRPGEDLHLDALRRQPPRQLDDVHIEATRIPRAGLVERGRVHAEHGDAMGVAWRSSDRDDRRDGGACA